MTTTTQVFIRSFRGYWVGPDKDAGYGLKLPSDLQPIEPNVSIHSRKWNIWYSSATKRYIRLIYNEMSCEWYGYRLRSRSRNAAISEVLAADAEREGHEGREQEIEDQ